MRSKNFIVPLMCLLFAFFLEMPLSSSSMNAQVVKGEVSLVEQKEVTKIHASDDSVIQYTSFEVKEGQEVKIIQPSKDSILIIKIDSNQPTRIRSKLSANGTVYLVNPHGIFLDKTAVVEKGSFHFIGSELLSDNVKEVINIKTATGDVVNHGQITSYGEVHFMGRHVVNSGLIDAQEKVKISHTNAKNQLSILHTGTIRSKDVFIEGRDGAVEIYGVIDAKNAIEQQYGGNICVLGQHVRLIGAYLDASGTFAGGQVNLGGDLEGNGPLFKATRTSVDNTSVIDASAIEYGQGGEVVLWSKELTSFQGEIFARGGRKHGAGGRVETSSLNQLGIYSGKVNVDAACGEAGIWMLDPSNIVISDAEEATDDLSLVTEFPAKSGSQVTINVKTLNNFSGGKLQIAASNRITIDADISNISSTLELTLRAGNQIRFKNENIYIPNGKVSFIIDNQESGQIVCAKNFKRITAHQMEMIAPKGEGNGLLVETNNLVLNPSNSNRSEPLFVISTDVVAKNNSDHKIYLQRAKSTPGRVEIEGSLIGFDLVDSETHFAVFGVSQIGELVTKGSTQVELLGGGTITGQAELTNTRGITLGGNASSVFTVNGSLNTASSVTKLCGKIVTSGDFEASDVRLLGNTFIQTNNNPFIVHENIAQENTLANLVLQTGNAHVTVEGSIYVNDFQIQSKVAPALCGEVCVCNFKSSTPEMRFAHDLIVSGQMDCFNLTTSGENKKVAFAKGGSFKGKTTFDHSGTTTLGNDSLASFNFEDMLDTHRSITFTSGLIYVEGPVEMKELSLLGDTTIQSFGSSCNIAGSIDQKEENCTLMIDTKNDLITLGNHIRVEGLVLNTTSPIQVGVSVHVTTLSTNAPSISFSNHLYVDGILTANNFETSGEASELHIQEGAKINGSCILNNGANLTLGKDASAEFTVNNRFQCKSTKAYLQGQFDVMGQVDLYDVELLGNALFKTHGYHFNVEKDIFQGSGAFDFTVMADSGEINLGRDVYVTNLSLETSSPIYIQSEIETVNLNSTSPLTTFGNETLVKGQIHSKSIASVGKSKRVQFNKGGLIQGDAKLSNTGEFILGQSKDDTLELTGAFDRSNGKTIAQGCIRTHAAAIDFEELNLSGSLNILSLSNDGDGGQISFHAAVDGAYPLNINAGNSKVYIHRPFGDAVALGALSIYSNELNAKADITIEGGAGEFYTNIFLANNVAIDDFGKQGLFFFGKINGDFDLNAFSNNLIVVKKDIGASSPLNAANFKAKRIDVWGSIAANSGSILFDGDVELCENVRFINRGIAGVTFNGRVDGDNYLEIKVDENHGKICFNGDIGSFQAIRHMVLTTQNPVLFNKKVNVDHFETISPLSTFMDDVFVAGNFNVKNVLFDGARQNVSLLGGGEVLGNATFNNKGDLCLGNDDQCEFTFGGIVSRVDGPTYARGQLTTRGLIADFSALHAVGDLKMKSANPSGTNFNFNSTVDGAHQIEINAQNGVVCFYDYVGNNHALTALEVAAKTVAMQRQVTVREGKVVLNSDLSLMNHASIKNLGGEGIYLAGNVNGEWNITFASDSDIQILGSVGLQNPVNHLIIETPSQVEFAQKVVAYNIKTSSPMMTFNSDVEVKKQIFAKNVAVEGDHTNCSLLGGGYLQGDLDLNNKEGVTILGDNIYSSLTTDGQMNILTECTYAQGLLQTKSENFEIQKLHLSGPLKVSSCAKNSSGAAIAFNKTIDGNQPFDVFAGNSKVSFLGAAGQSEKLQNLNIEASLINLGADISILEGSTVFKGNVELKNNIEVSDQGSGVISFLGEVNGPYQLDVVNAHEMGQISFAKGVGRAEALTALNLETQSKVEFPLEFAAYSVSTSSPSLLFGDEVTVYNEITAHNVVTHGKYRSVRLLGKGNFSGVVTFSNTGSLVLGNSSESEFNFSGPLSVQDCALITYGSIQTAGSVNLRELTLKGNTQIATQDHDFSVAGAIDQLSEGINLELNIGLAQAQFGSKIAIGNIKLNTSEPLEFHNAVEVGNFETNAPHVLFAANTTIQGQIEANDITTVGTNNKVQLLGGGVVKGNAVMRNGNGLCFGANEQAVLTFYGPIDTTASTLETRGTIQTVDKTIDLGNLNVLGNTTIRSNSKDSSGKDIYFLGSIQGPRQLRANAGKAKICFENSVGSKTALESLQATASKIEVDGDINSVDGNVVFAGDVVFTNTSNLTASGMGNIIFQGTVNVDDKAAQPVDLFLDATGKIEFQKDVGDSKAFNEVVVTRAGELICRSPLKSNIITQGKARGVENTAAAKKEDSIKKDSTDKVETKENLASNDSTKVGV